MSPFASASRFSSSLPVVVQALSWDAVRRAIVVVCDDGRVRRCRVDLLPSLEMGRSLFVALRAASRLDKVLVQFVSAGDWSPDEWFCGLVVIDGVDAEMCGWQFSPHGVGTERLVVLARARMAAAVAKQQAKLEEDEADAAQYQ